MVPSIAATYSYKKCMCAQSREYDEAMAILRARAVDLDVQRKQFNSMRSQHKALNASLAALADDKAAAESVAVAARARSESAGRHAALAAEAANDRARAMASLMVEVARLKGLPEPAREPLPFPNVAEVWSCATFMCMSCKILERRFHSPVAK